MTLEEMKEKMDRMRTRTLIDEMVRQLSAEVLSGDLEPGDRMPSYRALNERFDVTMPTTQRAMAKLEEMGLVQIRQGSGVIVLDPLVSAHPGVLPYWLDALRDEPSRARRVLEDFLEMRRDLAARLVLRCRHHADDGDLEAIRTCVEKMAVLVDRSESIEDIVEADIDVIEAMIRAGDQLAIATVFSAFARAARVLPDLQVAMYSSPTHNVDAWDGALSMIEADARTDDASVEQKVREDLARIDRHTVDQFVKLLENAI